MVSLQPFNATIAPMLQFISPRRRLSWVFAVLFAAVFASAGCGGDAVSPQQEPSPPPAAPTAAPAFRVVVLGDSLAAGLGLAAGDAFPAVVDAALRERGLDVEVVNAGVSGDTSAGGLARIDWVLRQPADVLVVALGGNDALRGQPLASTAENLREIVRRGHETGATVVLLGMDVPTNYGPDYATTFAELYPVIADEEGAVLIPGFVRILGAEPELLQPDGLHPTAEGQRRLADQLVPVLIEVIEAR